uniref:Uncharacterized protein n=1 Tax=Oryza nivara TaxID=4536 RepID=A0A0E0GP14_ORYNI
MCPEARLASKPPSLDLTNFRLQPLTPYLIGTVAKGVGVAKGVQRLVLGAVPHWCCGERCPEARLASRPPFSPLDLTHFRPQPLAPYLIGIVAKGMGVAKEARLASKPPSLDLTNFHPQPLTPYLIGTVAKGMGATKPFHPQPLTPYFIGILAKGLGMVKGVQRLGWLRSPPAGT